MNFSLPERSVCSSFSTENCYSFPETRSTKAIAKTENTSCKLYTEQPHTTGYFRSEPHYQRYADRRHRSGRNRNEAGIHSGIDAPRLRTLRHLYFRRSGTGLRRRCGRYHTGSDPGKRTLLQKPHHRIGKLPQPAAVICRRHARHTHYDCRPRECHAADKRQQE